MRPDGVEDAMFQRFILVYIITFHIFRFPSDHVVSVIVHSTFKPIYLAVNIVHFHCDTITISKHYVQFLSLVITFQVFYFQTIHLRSIFQSGPFREIAAQNHSHDVGFDVVVAASRTYYCCTAA